LQQRWRERAADARIGRAGEDKHPVAHVGTFTRRDLLNLFPPSPGVEAVLSGTNPGRAKHYWREAIAALKDARIIRYYKELETLQRRRQTWQKEWLDQSLDIRPDAEGTLAIVEIRTRAKKAQEARGPQQRRTARDEG
jgi:hypothetical protein